jgi:Spy/CpxP family protein refolding chaperone
MHKDAQARLDKLREKIGMDITKDAHGVTVYGKEPGKETGVLIVHAKLDQKFLLDKAEKAPDHKVVKFEAYDLHSWTAKHHGKTRTVWGAFYKADRLVFASSMDELKGALQVLDGKSPGAGESPLHGDVRPGTTVLFRATGLRKAELPAKCPFAKYVEAFRFSMGEKEGKSFFSAKVVAKNEDVAEDLKGVVEGLKALAALHAGGDAKAKKLVDALHVTTHGKALSIHWTAPADAVWNMVEKHAKWLAEHHGMMGWPAHKPAPGKQDGAAGRLAPMNMPWFNNLNLTPEQQAKWAAVGKEYEPKFKSAWNKMENILTDDQKKARDEAVKTAYAAGKNGKDVWDAAEAAMKLTDEQKAKRSAAQKEVGSLYKEFGEKFRALLTPEQRAKLGPPWPPKEEKKPEEKPKQAVEIDDDK